MIPEINMLIQAAGLGFVGFSTALVTLIVVARYSRSGNTAPPVPIAEIVFLFDGDTMVDMSDAGRRLFKLTEPNGNDLARLTAFLSPRFPALRGGLAGLETGDDILTSNDGQSRLCLSKDAKGLRLRLEDSGPNTPFLAPDRYSVTALTEELTMYRTLGDTTPFPVWRQTEDGRILWANGEYRALAERLGHPASGPTEQKPIFIEDLVGADKPRTIRRAKLELPREAEPKWFEFQVNRLGNDLLVAAIPVDRVVRAERSLNDFVQTLTQTFAHLNVGLAVFNRTRELALFNPALSDLLGLPPEFLITRPTLFQLFDRLREKRMVPEPKDYKSWRRQMSALEAAAADGAHSETWSLCDGRTYRVTGRPHPEGAVAFLFEDISAEISLERKFRAELQMGQAVIDGLSEAIAVFSPSGEMVMSNRSYAMLWHDRAALAAKELTVVEASRSWQRLSVPTPVWGDVRDFAATMGERCNWTADVRMRDGRRLACRFDALAGGLTLVGFSEPAGAMFAPLSTSETSISA